MTADNTWETTENTPSRQLLLADLGQALRHTLRREERRIGRALDKAALARRVSVSRNSIYAYLDGRRLPSAPVLDTLLAELGADAEERRRLGELRDMITELRYRSSARTSSAVGPPEPPRQRTAEVSGLIDTTEAPHRDDLTAARGRPPSTARRRAGRRHGVALACAAVVMGGAGAAGWQVLRPPDPQVVIEKGPSAVGQFYRSGMRCRDSSCSYVTIRLHHFMPNHTYLGTCRSNGGMDPLENRNGFATIRIHTNDQGYGEARKSPQCLWGYQGTWVWVTVQSNDGIEPLMSNRLRW